MGAQPGDAVRGGWVVGAGAPTLAGEDRGDLLVGAALGELAHGRDGVWSVLLVWLPVRGSGTLCVVRAPPFYTTRSSAACCSEVRSTVTRRR
jgi:hypothetical protein